MTLAHSSAILALRIGEIERVLRGLFFWRHRHICNEFATQKEVDCERHGGSGAPRGCICFNGVAGARGESDDFSRNAGARAGAGREHGLHGGLVR